MHRRGVRPVRRAKGRRRRCRCDRRRARVRARGTCGFGHGCCGQQGRARARIGSFRRWRRGRGARDVARARAAGGGGRHQRDAARDDHFGGARGLRRARLFWKYCCDDFGTRGRCPCRKDLQPAPGDRGRHLHPGHDGHRRASQSRCLARQHRARDPAACGYGAARSRAHARQLRRAVHLGAFPLKRCAGGLHLQLCGRCD